MEAKIQSQIIDYFSFFEEFHNTTKDRLKDCQNCAAAINRLIKRYRNVKESELSGTPLEEFEGLQNKLCASIHNLISKEIERIREILNTLEELFRNLCFKNKVLRESCRDVSFDNTTLLVKGTPLQPPLKQLLEFASDTVTFGAQVCALIDTSLNVLICKVRLRKRSGNFEMDLLDSILNSMQTPPSTSEAQKNAMKKQKEAIEKKQKEEKHMINKFRKRVEEKICEFVSDGKKPYLQFEPMDQMYRSIIRDVADCAGTQVYSFGQDGVDRYSVIYTKENGPTEDELTVRRAGGAWDDQKAAEMVQMHIDKKRQAILDSEDEKYRKRKRGNEELSGTFYKQKYAHLIGQEAALGAAQKTNMNKNYGEVPSENKKDLRSIEQTMADIKAKKMKKAENGEGSTDNVQT